MLESHAKAAGHAMHQQLVVLPLGLLVTAAVFDVLGLLTDNPGFTTASYYMIPAGILTGIAAIIPGVIDYLAIPKGTRAKRIGLLHGAGNELMLMLFAVSWFLRPDEGGHAPGTLALVVALAGLALSGVTGWLGGELVGRLGVGVDPDANLDNPASFKTGIRFGSDSSR